MAALSLLVKDFREHRLAALVLGLGSLVIVLLLLAQNASAAYSMSPFEIVRFALLSFIPLVALIVGNRLIVREYLSGTRLFVEALPVGPDLPLLLKYLLGFAYLAALAVLMILLAARHGGLVDDVTLDYVLLITLKTLAITALYWSVVFCFSLCGHLRIALYLVTAALLALIAWYPGIDTSRLAPFAIMDDQLFVFERDLVPWGQLAGTVLLALLFTLAGFVLTRLGEGSVVERLARPMTRRDYVALGVLAASGLTLWATLAKENQREPVDFSSESVVRLLDPLVSVLYLEDVHEAAALALAERTQASLIALQATLGLSRVPDVRLALAPDREPLDFDYSTADGVFISGNWLEHDSYDATIFDTVIMHGVMSAQTGDRAMFEPYHWVLDGFTRWWVEQGTGQLDPEHRAELLARALWTLDLDPGAFQLVERWQLTADRFSYPSAESLAWVAMHWLEASQGREAVLALASEFLVRPLDTNIMATLYDRRVAIERRYERVLGMPLRQFHVQWQEWLLEQSRDEPVQRYLQRIPALEGRVVSSTSATGVHEVTAGYGLLESDLPLDTSIDTLGGRCVMKHDYIGPFDTEFDVTDDYEDAVQCRLGPAVHTLNSVYSPGDRIFIALDYESDDFHQPLRLHAERLTIQ